MLKLLTKVIRSPFVRSISKSYAPLIEGNGLSYKAFITQDNKKISPWHNVPLWANRVEEVYMVNEITK